MFHHPTRSPPLNPEVCDVPLHSCPGYVRILEVPGKNINYSINDGYIYDVSDVTRFQSSPSNRLA